ncbi:hypothetical protein SAMN05660226_01585 [Parapedobacter luteus]|uniref:Uncharacterized protein n=1 Tax=Parapedobacter luteus TaxID=623280 RepID=A0A1T5BM76_9SPHI|nr:hypothetical protein SAMN05660226_01585 [Parapedobacter luteus]
MFQQELMDFNETMLGNFMRSAIFSLMLVAGRRLVYHPQYFQLPSL